VKRKFTARLLINIIIRYIILFKNFTGFFVTTVIRRFLHFYCVGCIRVNISALLDSGTSVFRMSYYSIVTELQTNERNNVKSIVLAEKRRHDKFQEKLIHFRAS